MDALFQIGQQFATLESRVLKLEEGSRNGQRSERGLRDADLPREQRRILSLLRSKHSEIAKAINDALQAVGIKEDLQVLSFTLADVNVIEAKEPFEDDEMCCMCCPDPNGYVYCCDFEACSSCC